MTYIPPERDEDGPLDRTQALPDLGDGDGPTGPFDPAPTVPFPADRGGAEPPSPEAEPPRRDRIVFHLVWEALLMLLTANAVFLVYQRREGIFGDVSLTEAANAELRALAPLLLLAAALGMSLRLGAVNLALPAVACLVLAVPKLFVGDRPQVGLGLVAAAAAAVTILFCLLVLLLRLPAWIAGLACLFAVWAAVPFADRLASGLGSDAVSPWSLPEGPWLFAGAAAVSVAGGLLGLLPGVRNRFSLVKGAVEGSKRRGAASVLTLVGGTFVSVLLAGAAGFVPNAFEAAEPASQGVLFETRAYSSGPEFLLSLFVLIAVLLGGTSLWGRRGGVAGTALALVLLWALALVWTDFHPPASDREPFSEWTGAVLAGMLLAGLLVSFGLDRLGRPKRRPPSEEPAASLPGEPAPFTPEPGGLFDPDRTARSGER